MSQFRGLESKVTAGSVPSEEGSVPGPCPRPVDDCLLPGSSLSSLYKSLCPRLLFSEDTSHIGAGPTLMTAFELDYSCQYPFPLSHNTCYWGLGFQHAYFGGAGKHNSSLNASRHFLSSGSRMGAPAACLCPASDLNSTHRSHQSRGVSAALVAFRCPLPFKCSSFLNGQFRKSTNGGC